MLGHNPYYHGIIKQTIVAFGALFSDIKIERRQDDSVSGTVVQTIQVPLAYAPKEKWLVRIDQDPNLEGNTYTSLPRLSFEITGYSYDSQRKTNRMQQIKCGSGTTSSTHISTPTPYNVDVSLYVLTKTQEDALQIIEQILPFFTPEYTLSINAIPSMNLTQDIPVILNSLSVQDDYDGDFQTRRFVTHTLNFTLKMNLFGPKSTQKVITTVHTNVSENSDMTNDVANLTIVGNETTGVITSVSWLEHF
ncbi:tail sheath stabilizer and completion protein [uncultured Caudovirales phage]|uniref:Tail sheath stabilizer and completion protein n=1 Tax=uncultured Caudovirales phage TaxID=2100421 RepID=A0A6J5L045_9CAUD|nr:tail sheath stabilizer and completion protein [uncultured Caudovirales phage]